MQRRSCTQAVADAPTLQLTGRSGQRERFRTSWESAPNPDRSSTVINDSVFEGWTLVTTGDVQAGGKNGFEIWSSGDSMSNARNQPISVNAQTGKGQNWLELNDAGGTQTQTLGIERQIDTIAGADYRLSFDLAGRLGYSGAYTRIGVYVDGQRLSTLEPGSSATALSWQSIRIGFTGKGGPQTLRIVTEARQRDSGGRGSMLDDLALTETVTLNQGKAGSAIRLQAIDAQLTDTDGSESLQLTLGGLPVGTVISDGRRSFTASANNTVADLTGWNLSTLALTPPIQFSGKLELSVVATAIEASNGHRATVSQTLTLQVDPVPLARNGLVAFTASPEPKEATRFAVRHWQQTADRDQPALVINLGTTDYFADRLKQMDQAIHDALLRELGKTWWEDQ
ncbi:hypothetical protein [Parachitinimonas caeni]|uniref:DUF642 domain-containing protein n=1 Tax=Parachitinimonas caeni TaxID=3031301 RepID=A0ABT7E3K4_9NEIS|nr:hypothetical protein [Parachitinimonas caeni]MDK2126900.1 hypothetical protein [Parachitinimonas caeni]